jgi:hypothetical protein
VKHREQHPEHVDGCYACKLLGISFGADAMPTRTGDVSEKNAREKQLQKDLPAFARMTKEGKQPPSLRGADKFEAESK